MTKAPRCKLCGVNHWSYEQHKFARPAMQTAWEDVEKATAELEEAQQAVTESEVALVRGRPKRYENSAARQKAYRERHG